MSPPPTTSDRAIALHRHLRRIDVGDVSLEVFVEGTGPLCVLVHGWPETWWSWRHQIAPLVEAGFKVAVPNVRGYGGSDAPEEVGTYRMAALADDVAGLIEALGEEQAILIGHDWGAPIVWSTAVLRPERVRAVAGLSVPYLGRQGPAPPTEMFRAMYPERFFYILYFQRPDVPEAEFEANVRSALLRIYWMSSGESTPTLRQAMRSRKTGYLDGIDVPEALPSWLSAEDLDLYTHAFTTSGFRGGLNRYRNMDADWHAHPELDHARIEQPSFFIVGEHDSVLRYAPGVNLLDVMDPFYGDLRAKVVVPGAGHWVQQERPAEVNAALLAFLNEVRPGVSRG